MRQLSARLLLSLVSTVALFAGSAAQAVLIGPTAYTDYATGPFGTLGLTVEDFEDGLLNTPNVSASAGIVLTFGTLRDSVEATPNGYSYYSSGVTTLTFTFSGTLPTHAGIVWTDVGCLIGEGCPPIGLGAGDVYFEAFDAGLVSLGVIGPSYLGDGAANGGTAEDRFFGAIDAGGISKITIWMPNSDDWELDHLQYGTPVIVPEPATAMLLGFGLTGLAVRRRSARR